MVRLKLMNSKHKGMKWIHEEGIHIKGYAYIDGEFKNSKNLLEYLKKIKSPEQFHDFVKSLNGLFVIICEVNEYVMAATDRYGTFHLYYHLGREKFLIGDDAEGIAGEAGLNELNSNAAYDWLCCGFVSCDETLITGLKSSNSSECIVYDSKSKELVTKKYHIFVRNPANDEYSEIKAGLRPVFENAKKRFISSLEGKKVLLPLSGGVDSRFGALMLNEAGYDNVLCYTYGNPNGPEETLAKKTAEAYGFRHIFIPYNRRDWSGLFHSDEVADYIDFSSGLKATPHFSDLFAARYLAEIENPDECLIVPGHLGSVAESIFTTGNSYSSEDIIEKLIIKYFYYYGFKSKKIMTYLNDRLGIYSAEYRELTADQAQGIFDCAAYDTYRSNHIMMANKPYEFYGFDWRLPLMDNELVDYFKTVPLNYMQKSKILLCDFVTESAEGDPGIFKVGTTFIKKVLKNINDKRYYCIKPFDVFKLSGNEYGLPGIHRVLYRYYRNFLSYTAAKTLYNIKRDIKL